MSIGRRRALLLNLALATCTFVAGAGLAEWLSRRAAQARGTSADLHEASLVRHHPLLGWEKRPGADAWLVRPEYSVHLKVNAAGLRGPLVEGPPPPGVERVLLLGDSFAEGYTVDESDTVRARLEASLAGSGTHTQVLNAGTHGYSTDQEYLYYRDQGVLYGASDVVLLFYYNDLFGNTSADNGKPVFTLDGDRLVLHPPAEGGAERQDTAYRSAHLLPWHHSMALRLLSDRTARANPALHDALARVGLVEPIGHEAPAELWPFGPRHADAVDQMWRLTASLLSALADTAAGHHAHLLVTYVPARFEVYDGAWATTRARWDMDDGWRREAVEERLAGVCGGLHLPLLDLRGTLRAASRAERTYFHVDDHWTAAGNAVAARAIARSLHPSG